MGSDRMLHDEIVDNIRKCIVKELKPAQQCMEENLNGADEKLQASVMKTLGRARRG